MPAPLASSANAQPQNSGSSATRAPRGEGSKDFSQLLQGGAPGADGSSRPSNMPTSPAQGPASDSNGQSSAERRPDSAVVPEETAATVPPVQAKPAAEKDASATTEEAPWPPLGLAGLVLAVPTPADPAAALPAVATATDADGNALPSPAALPVAAALPSTAAATATATAEGDAPNGADQATTLPLPELVLPGKRGERGEGSDATLIGDRATAPLLHAPGNAAVQDLKAALATGNAIFNGEPTPKPVLGDDGFDQAIGARLGWLADQKIGHAHIRLSPDDMGPVDVRLQLNGDKVHASFSSPHVDVRQALESSLPRLRELLGEQGFQLAHADVGHQAPGGDGNASGQSGAAGMAGDGEPSPGDGSVSSAQLIRQRGLLDAYA